MSEDKKTRTRFDAVWEEMTEPIKPVNKPPPGREPVNPHQRYLFDVSVRVENGVVSPCLKCGCQAFTRDGGSRAICLGCPPPAPTYGIEYIDNSAFCVNDYKCWGCGKQSEVTMTLSQVNLYCLRCKKLTLHDMKVTAPTLATSRWIEPESKKTKVFSGSKATFTFNGKNVGFASGVEVVEYEPLDVLDDVAKNYIPGKYTASITMTLLPNNPIADLVEEFREKFGLLPFEMFARNQYNENTLRLAQYDWERRTGRTTRGLIEKIAEFMVSDRRWFFVVGHTERYTMDLANLARDMHSGLNLSREMPVRMISPTTFYRDGTEGRSDAVIYIDHTWNERRSRP